jgi:hypothetical protein
VPHVIVMPEVSEALGMILPREPLLAVLNRLYDQLENHCERYRHRRDPEQPDDFFDYVVYLVISAGDWFTFRFTVNDKIAPDSLFVVAVSALPGKART